LVALAAKNGASDARWAMVERYGINVLYTAPTEGQAIHAFVLLRHDYTGAPELAEELRQHVGSEMGPIAKPEDVKFVDSLPKTRSGKIMRRVLKARAQGLPEGDISTLEE
jgi:acetyl-CoA synthetase